MVTIQQKSVSFCGVLGNGGPGRSLYTLSDSVTSYERFMIPHWFINAVDFTRLFQVSRGVKCPVLLAVMRLTRNDMAGTSPFSVLRQDLIHELHRIKSLSGMYIKTSKIVWDLANGLKSRLVYEDIRNALDQVDSKYSFFKEALEAEHDTVSRTAKTHIDNCTYRKVLPAGSRKTIHYAIDPLNKKLTRTNSGENADIIECSEDALSHFNKLELHSRHIEQVLIREELVDAKAHDFSGTMLLRIDSLQADQRFDFLIGPIGKALPNPVHVLSTFFRDVLRIGSAVTAPLSRDEDVVISLLPFYNHKHHRGSTVNVVILDLDKFAEEVLERVTSLIGRLFLEFMKSHGVYGGEETHGSLHVIFVLEEAHNNIQSPRIPEEECIAGFEFEQTRHKGRIFGQSKVVATHRPSEMLKTVLSQWICFIVNRVQNPEDLHYIKEIVPGIYALMLEQIHTLTPQTALVLEKCVPAPTLVKISDMLQVFRCSAPQFNHYCVGDHPLVVDVVDICNKWDGCTTEDNARECV